jgi:hypothetical protein
MWLLPLNLAPFKAVPMTGVLGLGVVLPLLEVVKMLNNAQLFCSSLNNKSAVLLGWL